VKILNFPVSQVSVGLCSKSNTVEIRWKCLSLIHTVDVSQINLIDLI